MAILSPDVEDVLDAISAINGGACIIPEDIDTAVNHCISGLGGVAIRACAGKNPDYRRGFLIGWASCLEPS